MKKIMLAAMLLASSQAQATQFWTNDFNITHLFVAGAENYHFRVYGMTAQAQCSANTDAQYFAYFNESYQGSKGLMASLLMAYATGKQVRLFIEVDGNNYCQILEAFISG
jgi:hypothetical protein